jgi:hypothetical protein
MPADEFAKIVAANRSHGGRRSPLYRWMRARHDALAASLEIDGPAWIRVTEALREAGLTDGAGKPPTLSRVRTTWYHVKRDVAAARTKAEAKRKPSVAVAPVVVTTPQSSPPDTWRPANRQAADPTPVAAVVSCDRGAAASVSVDERLRAFRASLNTGKVRIPEPINPAKPKGK